MRFFKILKILSITLAVVIVVIIVAAFLVIGKNGLPVKDVEQSMSVTITTNESDIYGENTKDSSKEYTYYDNKEDALKDFSAINEDEPFHPDELKYIYEYETDSLVRLYYMVPEKSHRWHIICCYDLYMEDGKYSQIIDYDERRVDIAESGTSYYYDFADATAEFICYDFNPIVDDEKFVYCGFWDNKKEIESLTVCGQKVDTIKSLKFSDGKSTYMWIIKLDDIKPKMQTIEGKLTYGKMEEALDIKYIPVKREK